MSEQMTLITGTARRMGTGIDIRHAPASPAHTGAKVVRLPVVGATLH